MTAQPLDDPPEFEPPDVGSIDALDYDLAGIRHGIARLSDDVPAALDVDDTTETVVKLLAEIRTQRKALHELEAFVEAKAVKRLAYGRNEVAGFIAEVRGGKTRREWQTDDIAFEVCRDLIIDENGVRNEDMVEAVNIVRNRLVNCAQIRGWRVKQLRPLGVEPDDFCTFVVGRKTVQLIDASGEVIGGDKSADDEDGDAS